MKQKPEFRVETDLLGDVEIPSTAYWGIRTARANLDVSGLRAHTRLTESLVILKRSALDLSPAVSSKDRGIKEAVLSSCSEILEGKLQTDFIADPYYCNAAEAINVNVNDVIANRAEEILGGSIGSYARVNPDEDVDLWPGPKEMELRNAARIGLLLGFKDLEPAILDLERWFRRKSLECEQIIHSGEAGNGTAIRRSLGLELNSYGTTIERCHRRLLESVAGLQEISLANLSTTTEDKNGEAREKELIESVSKITGVALRIAEDKNLNFQSMYEFLQFSSALKELTVELSSIARNLCSSCSKFSQSLKLQESKRNRNPKDDHEKDMLKRMADLLALTACQVMANDYALAQCCHMVQGIVSVPFAANSLLQSLDLLQSTLGHFNLKCISEFTT
jgi:aspartate ammonia-lyase